MLASAHVIMPGSPSPVGRKPGICQTGQLVTREGPEGSNPSPGAYYEGIGEYHEADERKKEKVENLKMQMTSIDLRQRQQLYCVQKSLKVLHCIQALNIGKPSFKV
jgi:hypothetical protein